ncbi:MAG: hypothetical protein V2I43_26130 [Parvularcula sp.]|jgi:hypothetical protein|nr:hypothetical protein [Parvularcula sp.]
MSDQISALRRQLRELLADPRQRALLGLLLLLLLLQIVFALGDQKAALKTELARLQAERLRAEALAEAARDQDVSAAAAEAMAEARGLAYEAPTFALARLKAEQDLTRLLTASGLSGAQLRAEPEPTGEGAIRILRLTAEGRLEWSKMLAFLRALAESGKGVRVEGFALAPGAAQQFRLELSVPLMEGSAA